MSYEGDRELAALKYLTKIFVEVSAYTTTTDNSYGKSEEEQCILYAIAILVWRYSSILDKLQRAQRK